QYREWNCEVPGFHGLTNTLTAPPGTAEMLSLPAFQPRGRVRIPAPALLALPLKSAAPRKRSMVAWRRRPNPRVMQCPRQGFVWRGEKGSTRPRRIRRPICSLKRGFAGTYLLARGGLVLQIFPTIGDLAA